MYRDAYQFVKSLLKPSPNLRVKNTSTTTSAVLNTRHNVRQFNSICFEKRFWIDTNHTECRAGNRQRSHDVILSRYLSHGTILLQYCDMWSTVVIYCDFFHPFQLQIIFPKLNFVIIIYVT